MELGVYSFAEVPDATAPSAAQRLQDLLEEIVLADQLGLERRSSILMPCAPALARGQ